MNYLSSILGLGTNMSSYINFNSTLDILSQDMNYLTIMNQMYYLVISHPRYVTSGGTLSGNASIYLSNGSVVTSLSNTFSNITIDSAYNFLTQSEKLYSLRDRLGQNSSLTPSYVANTNLTIYTKLLNLRSLLVGTSSTDLNGVMNFSKFQNNGYFAPSFGVWSSRTLNTVARPPYITPLTSYDFSLICFINYLINQGVNNLLLDIDDQGVIEFYGIDSSQILLAYITATKTAAYSEADNYAILNDGRFNIYCLQVKTLASYCIGLINEEKNQVLMQGLPTYYILYCAFMLCMTKRKTQMIEIAQLNITVGGITLSFYPSGNTTNASNCILFANLGN
jgi:hypothetical protein